MATEAVKNTIRAAMSFKDTPAPNCRTGVKIRTSKDFMRERISLKDAIEKAKETKKDTPGEELI